MTYGFPMVCDRMVPHERVHTLVVRLSAATCGENIHCHPSLVGIKMAHLVVVIKACYIIFHSFGECIISEELVSPQLASTYMLT